MCTTIVHCVPTMSGVQFKIPLFNVGHAARELLVGHLSTFRPGFSLIECHRDGDTARGGKSVCTAGLPEDADGDTIMMAQKAIKAALAEFLPENEIVIDDQRVVH